MFLLLELVGEMDRQVMTGCIVRRTAESDVAIAIQDHVWLGSYHQHVHSDIKLASSQQQWRCDVSEERRRSYKFSHRVGVAYR